MYNKRPKKFSTLHIAIDRVDIYQRVAKPYLFLLVFIFIIIYFFTVTAPTATNHCLYINSMILYAVDVASVDPISSSNLLATFLCDIFKGVV